MPDPSPDALRRDVPDSWKDRMIDCSVCGWRHTVPCGRDDCPHDLATHYATITAALDNAVQNGCMEELSKMSAEDIAYDLARLDAGCERMPIEIIKAGVSAWLSPQHDDEEDIRTALEDLNLHCTDHAPDPDCEGCRLQLRGMRFVGGEK